MVSQRIAKIVNGLQKRIHELQISKGETVSKNLDLNTATEQELASIQGLGRENAKKIVDYCNQNGTFKSWEDLKRVPGMPTTMLDVLKRQGLTVGGKAAYRSKLRSTQSLPAIGRLFVSLQPLCTVAAVIDSHRPPLQLHIA